MLQNQFRNIKDVALKNSSKVHVKKLAFFLLIFLIASIDSIVGQMNKGVLQVPFFLRIVLGCKPHKTVFEQVQPEEKLR